MSVKRFAAFLVCVNAFAMASTAFAQSQVIREEVEGITNFARIETTVACAGAITPESVADIKNMGFSTIINLRRPSEEGANIEAEAAAAETAGIAFVHLPFGGEQLDTTVPDRFLETITQPGTQPAFIHCAGGGRAATMWFIKRVIVDDWDVDRAMEEATALGLRPESRLRDFALEYIAAHAG
ncbi:MAG: sulfur transferase domain-containing protein [Gammaproteobacteria bacterium]|jgi:uncharacterized protein (TIGR01244 family)